MTAHARPRLVDLAERLQVAPSTVSRALAGSGSISDATRTRVLTAAREMGYSVNPVASGLKRGKTSSIGLIAVMSYWYSGAVTSGADQVAADHDYDFVVMNAAGGLDPKLLVQRARRLGQRVDGALVIDIAEGPLLREITDALAVPVVTIGCETPGVPAVLVDNNEIGALAARHFRDLGHMSAAVLQSQNPSPLAYDNAVVRARAFVAASPNGAHSAVIPNGSIVERRQAILTAVESRSAVFCATDALAIETMATLRDAGRSVPGDVSVIGVDNHPLAAAVGLTTIAQEPEAMGALATAMVLEAATGTEPRTSASVSVEQDVYLVERTTTAPLASRG